MVIPSDRLSGHPKDYAFVEMSSNTEAKAAIKWLNGKTLEDRSLVISESHPRKDKGGSSNSNMRKNGYGSVGNYDDDKKRRYLPI